MLHQIEALPEKQSIEQQRKQRDEQKDQRLREHPSFLVVFDFEILVRRPSLLQHVLHSRLRVCRVVIVHVQLRIKRRGEGRGRQQRQRKVVDNVEEQEQLQRLHIPHPAAAEVFTAQIAGPPD